MGSHSPLRAHFDTLIIVLDTLPKEYYKLLVIQQCQSYEISKNGSKFAC